MNQRILIVLHQEHSTPGRVGRLLRQRGYELEVTFLGKIATWVIYAALALVLVTPEGTTWPLVILWIGIALSLAAGVQYALRAWRHVHPGRDSRAGVEP